MRSANEPMYFVVPPDYKEQFEYYHKQVQHFLSNHLHIPFPIAFGFFTYLIKEEDYKTNKYLAASLHISRIVSEQLPDKKYHFIWRRKIMYKEKEMLFKLNNGQIFMEAVQAFLTYKEDNPHVQKDDVIRFFYEAFTEHYKNELAKSAQGRLNDYKAMVIAGRLTMALGYKLSDKNNPKNTDVHQATRHAVKKKLM
jgi:hypothetical protein